MKKIASLFLLLLLGISASLHAQSFVLTTEGVGVTSLDGLWRFHTGDDPAWAKPDFDDSHWSLLRSYQTWPGQGYPGYGGIAWYRFSVEIPENFGPVSIDLPPINTCYQLFANGQLIGSYGKMPPHPVPYSDGMKQLYAVPDLIPMASADPKNTGRKLEIAIRVWEWPTYARLYGGGPLYIGGFIGRSGSIYALHGQFIEAKHWESSTTVILGLLETLAAFGAFSLFLLRRSEREYLYFSLIMLFSASFEWLKLSYTFTPWPILLHNQIESALIGPCLMLAEIGFYFRFLKGRRTPLFWIAIASSLAAIPFNVLGGLFELNIPAWYLGQDLLRLPAYLWILVLLFSRARRNYIDARLLVAPVVLQKASLIYQQLCVFAFTMNWKSLPSYWVAIIDKPFPIQLTELVDALFLTTMLAILVFRFSRTRSLEERYASEVEGARSVQQFLIPQQMPLVPGLAFESEYRPAREVGGDFFQIIHDPVDGSTLIVVGDVAGKGLQAGMLATLIVGALRTAATFTTDPVQILHTLNNRLCGRGNATCLALHISASGAATLVNAGHLPPYRNSEELPMEGALPLGILPGIEFPVLHFTLADGDSLVLMSDGIAEAQDHDGELFGFERVRKLIRDNSTAETIAAAAQKFGQTDDITVLSILRSRRTDKSESAARRTFQTQS